MKFKRKQNMKMIFRGVRGSRPVHGRKFLGHGGNSTCIEFHVDPSFCLLIDAGSGLANHSYQTDFAGCKRFHILITHTHWDHILTIPWFTPLFDPDAHITFYATEGSNGKFPELYEKLFDPRHLPTPQGCRKAKVDFVTVKPGVPFIVESKVRVEGFQLNHQAVTLGYKLSHGRANTVVITDTAPMSNNDFLGDGMKEAVLKQGPEAFKAQYHAELIGFLKGVHTLVFDSHFTDANLKADWGHSTPTYGLSLCKEAGVKQLLLFHHAPEDDDQSVERKLQAVQTQAKAAGIAVDNAKEETSWDLKSA